MNKISIIVPIYNAEEYLKESIESILNQSFHNFELILVNDGSADRSKEICESFSVLDERVKVINSENLGSGIARNKGISIATGEYCYFLDADDILLKDALKIMNEEINNVNADLYVFGYIITQRNARKEFKMPRIDLYVDGEEVRKQYEYYMREGETYIQGAPWNKLFRTKNIKENNIEYPNWRRNQDDAFTYRYMCTVKNIKFCNKYIYKYYSNDLKKQWQKFPKNYFDIRTNWYKEFKNTLSKWNPQNTRAVGLLTFSYIACISKCFEYMFNPNWTMNKESRKKYIKECLNNDDVQSALKFLIDNKKEIKSCLKEFNAKLSTTNLIFFQVKLMKKQRINLIYSTSKCIIKIVESYKKLLYASN